MSFKKNLLCTLLALGTISQSQAVEVSGWSMGEAGMWRLAEDPDYFFSKGSPARMLRADHTILNHQATFTLRQGLVNSIVFKVGCVFKSKIPLFELAVQPLDISIKDQFNGYSFVRFQVDDGQEYSLRGEYLPPARLVFAPLTKVQERSISDLFMQLQEGGLLHMAVLQGENDKPRVFSVPLTGFNALSQSVAQDCARLNQSAGIRTNYAPDYLTKEPAGYVKKGWSLKRPRPNDGLTPDDQNSLEKNSDATASSTQETSQNTEPAVQYFEPGGGVASIGADGKPVTSNTSTTNEDPDSLGEVKSGPMQIGADGSVVSTTQNTQNSNTTQNQATQPTQNP